MSISIRLDANALSSLIAGDPEFKFELSTAVVAEVVKRMYEKHVPNDITGVVAGLFQQHRKDLQVAVAEDEAMRVALERQLNEAIGNVKLEWSRKTVTLRPELAEAVGTRVREEALRVVDEAGLTSSSIVQAAIDRLTGPLEASIDRSVSIAVKKRIDDLVAAKVGERVNAAVAAALGEG